MTNKIAIHMHKELYIIGHFCCCFSIYEVGNITKNITKIMQARGGAKWNAVYISCGSTIPNLVCCVSLASFPGSPSFRAIIPLMTFDLKEKRRESLGDFVT